MLHHIADLYQVFFKLCPWGKKWPSPAGHIVYIGRNMKKIFSSEITRPRALMFGMKHHLVNVYQICSNYIPGAKNGPPTGSHVLNRPI